MVIGGIYIISIYGPAGHVSIMDTSGLLLSSQKAAERAAAERAAAERAAAKKWQLSARELAIVAHMGEENAQQMEMV